MKVFVLLLLAGMASATFPSINSIKTCVAGSSLEGRLLEAMKSCTLPDVLDSCDGRVRQVHDEHVCVSKKLGWSGVSGPNLAYMRDVKTLKDTDLQEALGKHMLGCSNGYSTAFQGEGCDGARNKVLVETHATMHCFLSIISGC